MVRLPWGMKVLLNGDAHVVPIRDSRTHKKSRKCWCEPRLENEYDDPTYEENPDAIVVIHDAADGRT